MASLNKILLIGRLTADPELKQTQSGVPVVTFSIAVNRRFTKQGEQPQTDFIRVTAWRQQAEFVSRYFSKGKAIFVLGALQQRTWTDQSGQKRYDYEVVADEVSFVESKAAEESYGGNRNFSVPDMPPVDSGVKAFSGGAQSTPAAQNDVFEDLASDDDLPF